MGNGHTQPPPGWYPDPAGSTGQRYWDGYAWDPTRPIPPTAIRFDEPNGATGQRTEHLVFLALGGLFLVAAAVIASAILTHGFRDDRSYQGGWVAAGNVRNNTQQSAKQMCEQQLDRSQMEKGMDWGDFVGGCVDRLHQALPNRK